MKIPLQMLRDAFDAIKRQLEKHLRLQRDVVKAHPGARQGGAA